MATVYHRDQTGAPLLTYKQVALDIANFTAIKEILKACLVNGYGAKPAAGWTLVNEGTNFIVLRNGAMSGYVCLSWTTSIVRVYLSETYTGMNGNVMTGGGLKTGTAANNGLPQCFNNYGFVWDSTCMTWYLVADEKTFVLGLGYHTANTAYNYNVNTPGALTLYVGEDSNGNFISVGGVNGSFTTTTFFTVPNSLFGATGFTALRDPSTGLLVDIGSLVVATPGLRTIYSANESETSSVVLAEVCLAPAVWIGGGLYAGRLRGIAMIPLLTFTVATNNAALSIGSLVAMTVRSANTPIDLGDGNTYFARLAHNTSSFFLVTDNPEFW